jgi:hypothetical protein
LNVRSGARPRLGAVAELVVTKEYREDLGTKDADGYYDYDYRYWDYSFDLDGRKYRARIYADTPEEANVMHLEDARPAEFEDDLVTIGEYMRREAGVIAICILGATGTFEPAITYE